METALGFVKDVKGPNGYHRNAAKCARAAVTSERSSLPTAPGDDRRVVCSAVASCTRAIDAHLAPVGKFVCDGLP